MPELSSRRIDGVGTGEAEWGAWNLDELEELELAERHLVVVAPHPDDEVLGVGGTLVLCAERGDSIEIVALTDGERGSVSGRPSAGLASVRRAETIEALRRLLGGVPPVHYAGLPDGALDAALDEAVDAIRTRLRPGAVCLAPFRADGHPDHEAAYRAAARACSEAGCRLVEYPVWMWHWAIPEELGAVVPHLRRVALPEHARAAKQRAIAAFTSQLPAPGRAGILPANVTVRFGRRNEVFVT